MKQTIGCYHAHHSNIQVIENALGHLDVEWVHFVDPGLDRLKVDSGYTEAMAREKLKEAMAWVTKCRVDAVLITCTYFTAQLSATDLISYSVPIFKIDEPLQQELGSFEKPILFVFSNPSTVNGTMAQIRSSIENQDAEVQMNAMVLEDTFDLLMAGRQSEYQVAIQEGLRQAIHNHPQHLICAAQLSMVPAAETVRAETGIEVVHYISALERAMITTLHLDLK